MNAKLFQVTIRIFVLTGVFFVLINVFGYVLNISRSDAASSNKENYTSNDIEILGNVGVALAVNIGTREKAISETPINLYKNVFSISEIISDNNKVKDELITANMVNLNEYLNILKTDIKGLLESSNDRSTTLNALIDQLEYRYKVGTENIQTLNLQKTQLTASYNSSVQKINSIKTKISTDYGNMDTSSTLENIDGYLKLVEESNYSRTYIVFINKFLSSYAILNNYNKLLLDTLINNKEILVKNTQVVLPDSGGDLLKKLNLIYDEKDWKSQN